MALPVIPPQVNRLIQNNQGRLSTYPFPPNIAAQISKKDRQKLMQWWLQVYGWPQIMERHPYEDTWDRLLSMARATWKYSDSDIAEGTRLERRQQARILDSNGDEIESTTGLTDRIKIADTVIFDAIDRLTNLNHFISFKEGLPVRYDLPVDYAAAYENDVYSPMTNLLKSANCWLRFIGANENIPRKHFITAKHHYTYGVSFVCSEFFQKIEMVERRDQNKKPVQVPELTELTIGFEPISIRKLWLNYRISASKMEHQPCPFFFEEMPRFAIVANQYHPEANPMGYSNLEALMGMKGDYLFSGQETTAMQAAFESVYPDTKINFSQILRPEYSVELLWTAYPMLPIALLPDPEAEKLIDPTTGKLPEGETGFKLWIEKMPDPRDPTKEIPIPMKRYVMQTFGGNLAQGNQEIIRLQESFYPHNWLPLFGSQHMPSLDDGAYSPAIGSILEGHYTQLCKALLQYMENKDWVNDPPTEIMQNSPAMSHNVNKPGERIPVMSMNDIKRREAFDGTGTTLQFMELTREASKTSSKATEAILGKAMGSRTSATEAQNVFQTAMSGVTTDINLFNGDIMGGWAERVWEYTGKWVDPDVLQVITGSFGFAIRPEHMSIRFGLKYDVGSQYIESITRQQNIQYLLQACPPGCTDLNRAELFNELLNEWRFKNRRTIVNDGGREQQIQLSTQQAIQTYMGDLVMVDPDQDHDIAIRVKKSFLTDRESYWNKTPELVINGPKLVQQIELHQYFKQMQLLQQQIMMQQQMLMGDPNALQPLQSGGQAPQPNPGKMATSPGQARQKTGK